MDDYRRQLIEAMNAYCASANIAPSTLGKRAGQGGTFYRRLVEGMRVYPETAQKVLAYMAENPPKAKP